jgi:hypothetical protein
MSASDASDDRASSDELSMCAGTARTVADVLQTVEPERRNKEIPHAWSSCMRNSSKPAVRTAGKTAFRTLGVNRISSPIPKSCVAEAMARRAGV